MDVSCRTITEENSWEQTEQWALNASRLLMRLWRPPVGAGTLRLGTRALLDWNASEAWYKLIFWIKPSTLLCPPSVFVTSCWWGRTWSRSVRPRSSTGLGPGSTRRSRSRITHTSGGPAGPRRARRTRTAVAEEQKEEKTFPSYYCHREETWQRIMELQIHQRNVVNSHKNVFVLIHPGRSQQKCSLSRPSFFVDSLKTSLRVKRFIFILLMFETEVYSFTHPLGRQLHAQDGGRSLQEKCTEKFREGQMKYILNCLWVFIHRA